MMREAEIKGLVLATALVVLLAACGGDKGPPPTPTPESEAMICALAFVEEIGVGEDFAPFYAELFGTSLCGLECDNLQEALDNDSFTEEQSELLRSLAVCE